MSVLVGLGLNAAFGWTWADPLVVLVVGGFPAYAGVDAWQGGGAGARLNSDVRAGAGSPLRECRQQHELDGG